MGLAWEQIGQDKPTKDPNVLVEASQGKYEDRVDKADKASLALNTPQGAEPTPFRIKGGGV